MLAVIPILNMQVQQFNPHISDAKRAGVLYVAPALFYILAVQQYRTVLYYLTEAPWLSLPHSPL